MKKRAAIIAGTATIVMSTLLAIPAFGGTIIEEYIIPELGMKVTTEITYDENGKEVITTHSSPINGYSFPSETESLYMTEGYQVEKAPALKEAPEVGTVLAHILNESASPESKSSERYMKPYQAGNIGQCTWYARGRFQEIYNIELAIVGSAGEWLLNAENFKYLKTISDLSDVPEQSIAVFETTEEFPNAPGHVEFVEYVERNENGRPLTVYYTDANGSVDKRKNEYDKSDGRVQRKSFEEFKNPYGGKLIGYILPSDEILK